MPWDTRSDAAREVEERGGGGGTDRGPVLPWPDPFPLFVGRAFLSNADGVVDDIREVRYSNFEFYDEPEVLPDHARGLARLKMDVYFLIPDLDAPGGTRPNREKSPNPLTFTRYVVVSKEHKTFQTRGFSLDSHYSKMESMETVHIDEDWVYARCPLTSGLSVETCLNSDNTVLRECNFNLAEVKRTGDWTKGALYAIRAPDPSERRRPGRKIVPPPPDRTSEHMELFKTIFTAQDSAFWNPTDSSPRPVDCVVRFKELTAVRVLEQCLSAHAEIELTFPVSKTDIVDWIAAADRSLWVPLWTPPRFAVANPAIDSKRAVVTHLPYELVDTKGKYYARTVLVVRGDFFETFDMRHFPFDAQALELALAAVECREKDCTFVTSAVTTDIDGKEISIRDTAWALVGAHAYCAFRPGCGLIQSPSPRDVGLLTRGRYCIVAQATAQRHVASHVYRVMGMLALFSLFSLSAFLPNRSSTPVDRITFTAILLLATAVYSSAVWGELPTMGTLTLLDVYILSAYFFILVVSLQVVVVDWVEYDHGLGLAKEDLYNYLTRANIAAWVVAHVALVLYVRAFVTPVEVAKVGRLRDALMKLAPPASAALERRGASPKSSHTIKK